ncbi:MAG: hypothetical protein KKE96_07400, partial [Candidatus Altiarchaeota archaeon]|nr:hypothetical protein [Candidatus Altiarchaeota archaeon]
MKRYLAIVMLLLLVSGCTTGPPETSTTTTSTSTTSSTSTTTTTTSTTTTTTIKTFDTISIATWNLEGFKWSSYLIPTTKTSILTELRKYDILAAQGIPDGFEKYASLLMNDLPEYSYVTEDEYAFLYLDDITLLSHHTPNASSIRTWITRGVLLFIGLFLLKKPSSGFKTISLWLLLSIASIAFYYGSIPPYYLAFLFPAVFMLIGEILSRLKGKLLFVSL